MIRTLPHLPLASLLVAVATASTACFSPPLADKGDTGSQTCSATASDLDAVFGQACPATYDLALITGPRCNNGFGPIVRVGPLGSGLAYAMSWGTHAKNCYYDATTKALVGAVACDDVASYCGSSSTTIQFGTAPSECLVIANPTTESACTSPTDAAGAADAPSACTDTEATLDSIFGHTCPTTYDDALASSPSCGGAFDPSVKVGPIGDALAYAMDWGTHAKNCYYDANSKALVGIVACNDIPSYCGSASSTVQFGSTTATCAVVATPVASKGCP